MTRTLTLATLASLMLGALPALPVAAATATLSAADAGIALPAGDVFEKRRPRVPGGSGCDSPRDVAEHPECRR